MCPASHPAVKATTWLTENIGKKYKLTPISSVPWKSHLKPPTLSSKCLLSWRKFINKSSLITVPDLADVDPHTLAETLDPLSHGERLGHDAEARQRGASYHADRRAAARESGR